jgi:hypothetical protein
MVVVLKIAKGRFLMANRALVAAIDEDAVADDDKSQRRATDLPVTDDERSMVTSFLVSILLVYAFNK